MERRGTARIPWKKIEGLLKELLSYEEQTCAGRPASSSLLNALMSDSANDRWMAFLRNGNSCRMVLENALTLYKQESTHPAKTIEDLRLLVNSIPSTGHTLKDLVTGYLSYRSQIPMDVRSTIERKAIDGCRDAFEATISFASEMERLKGLGLLSAVPDEIIAHWYRNIADGKVSNGQAKALPGLMSEARDRLMAHMKQATRSQAIEDKKVFESQALVFKSDDIPGAVDVVLAAHKNGLRLETWELEPFLSNLTSAETVSRFQKMKPWMDKVNAHNPGFALTPKVIQYLAQSDDFDAHLAELDRLRDATRRGQFCFDNIIQRELEFKRFTFEYTKLNPTIRGAGPYTTYISKTYNELYHLFAELKELPPPEEPKKYELAGQHLLETGRVAYEAALFLRFLLELRTKSGRPVAVIGNDRYGRQWFVEPIEDYLKDGFMIHYDRVPSHMSTRLTVASARYGESSTDGVGNWSSNAMPREFVKEIARRMPHVVIVDGMNSGGDGNIMKVSRGTQGYANWFVAFNDVRAQGDVAKFVDDCCMPAGHIPELQRWYEYVSLRRQLVDWIQPGQTYRITHWTPEPTELALVGNITVPCRLPDVKSQKPLVVLSNPMIYRTEGDDLPEVLKGTRPYYFDGPERHVREKILLGFGPYGFETRVEGHTTASFVTEIQKQITAQVGQWLVKWKVPISGKV